ncbi:EcsC family protein [Alkalicella caledoniensis]|uniref:EcsC family protein n=1 Tax=Alkalicella caledoniensis TaxID=2731377 RepID=A0A7G9W3P0_ALKCA|nr:EcsC family protein [Alkalicella caledoniensis]QNO13302.1 EcsC family protein [Alkalicella caledoniensis]
MKLSSTELLELRKVKIWEKNYIEKNQNKILAKSGQFISNSLDKVSKASPEYVRKLSGKVTEATQTALVGCMDAGQDLVKYTYDKDKAVKRFKNDGVSSLKDLVKVDVSKLDELARGVVFENKVAGGVEGFVMGLGDITAAIIDIPIFFTLTFRVMQQIAAIYGYDPEDPIEKLYMIKLLSFGTAVKTSGKIAIQAELQMLRIAIKRFSFMKLEEIGGKYAVIIAARNVGKNVGKRLTRKTLLKGIPMVGGVFGGFFNYGFIKDIAEVANMMYKKRYLEDKLETEILFDSLA